MKSRRRPSDPACDFHENPTELHDRHEELLQKHGWYSHYVPVSRMQVNYHTHGVEAWGGHRNFQLVLPIAPNILHGIATNLVERVKRGERFETGMRVSGVISNYEILLIDATENDRPVLRVILPDERGNLEQERLSGIYVAQYDNLVM